MANKADKQLDKAFIDEMQNALINEKETLEKGLGKIADKDPKIKVNYVTKFPVFGANEEADRMFENADEVEDYTNNIGTENILELRLSAVERALDRIAAGSYGACSNCDGTHSQDRLRANPAADRCMDCGKVA